MKTGYEGKVQHKVVVAWELDQRIENPESEYNGKRFVQSKRYTMSLHEKSSLRKDLESWRGRAFTAEELQGFDLEKLIGACCLMSIVHAEKDGKTYANLSAIMALPKGTEKLAVETPPDAPEWVRKLQSNKIPNIQFSDEAVQF